MFDKSEERQLTKQDIKITRLVFLLVFIGYFSKYGLNLYLAHHLSAKLYGDFNVAVRVLNIWVLVALFGTNVGAVRFLPSYLKLHKKLTAIDYIAWNIKIIKISFIVTFAIAIITFLTMYLLHRYGIRHIGDYHLATYMFWLVPFAAISSLLCSFLLSMNHIILPTILNNIIRYLLQLVLFIAMILVTGQALTKISIVSILFVSFLILSVLTFICIKSELLFMLYLGYKKVRKVSIIQKKWLGTSSRLIGNSIVFSIVTVLDLIIVEAITPNKSDVGHYAAVIMIIIIIGIFPGNVYQTLKPKISHLLSTKLGHVKLQHELDKINKISFSIMTTLTILIVCFSETLLSYFGPHYVTARPALIIMSICTLLSGYARIASVLLVYSGYEKLVLNYAIQQFSCMIILALPATYYWGITGTALATGFIMCANSVTTIFDVRKKLKLRSVLFF